MRGRKCGVFLFCGHWFVHVIRVLRGGHRASEGLGRIWAKRMRRDDLRRVHIYADIVPRHVRQRLWYQYIDEWAYHVFLL